MVKMIQNDNSNINHVTQRLLQGWRQQCIAHCFRGRQKKSFAYN